MIAVVLAAVAFVVSFVVLVVTWFDITGRVCFTCGRWHLHESWSCRCGSTRRVESKT